MPTSSPSTSAQQARQALADQLREIREDAGLTATALAVAAGWHGKSKISKIEHGVRPISAADLRTWCRACWVSQERTVELLAERRDVARMWVSYKRLHRTGLRQAQTAIRPIYERARLIRNYQERVMPGLLQTRAYTQAALTAARAELNLALDDVAEAVAERMERQRILHTGHGRFLFVIEEAVLRQRTCETDAHTGQLRHLLDVMRLPAVSLGIIPADTPRTGVWPEEAFTMFDTELVGVELVSGKLSITQPAEIELYLRAWERLSALAVHGQRARQIITSKLTDLEPPGPPPTAQ